MILIMFFKAQENRRFSVRNMASKLYSDKILALYKIKKLRFCDLQQIFTKKQPDKNYQAVFILNKIKLIQIKKQQLFL